MCEGINIPGAALVSWVPSNAHLLHIDHPTPGVTPSAHRSSHTRGHTFCASSHSCFSVPCHCLSTSRSSSPGPAPRSQDSFMLVYSAYPNPHWCHRGNRVLTVALTWSEAKARPPISCPVPPLVEG